MKNKFIKTFESFIGDDMITITATDMDESNTMSRTFVINTIENLRINILAWEQEIPYRKYELMTDELIEDYNEDVIDLLDELEITY